MVTANPTAKARHIHTKTRSANRTPLQRSVENTHQGRKQMDHKLQYFSLMDGDWPEKIRLSHIRCLVTK